jgi:hypothetical protein
MSDTTDEAIALARRIVADGWNPDDLPLYPHEKVAVLARALIDATSPGAQFRAGMEAAAEAAIDVCRKEAEACLNDISPGDEIGSREARARAGVLLDIEADIRAAIAALPALTTEEQQHDIS